MRIKVIDAPADEPPQSLAEAVCREIASGDAEVEVAWSGNRRQVVRAVSQPVEELSQRDLPSGGNWIITGGARGITAATALELGRRYGVTLHLIGTKPAPREDAPWRHLSADQLKQFKAELVHKAVAAGRVPEDDWEQVKYDIEIYDNLRLFARSGVKAAYHACDLSDWNALAQVLNEVRAKDGPIQGILHGAGYGGSDRFESKKRKKVQRTLAGKLEGAIALMALTRQDPLGWFMAFGSLSGRWGGNGLSDYAAANDALAKLVGWFRHERPECNSTCCHWLNWDLGMSMLTQDMAILKSDMKIDLMPTAEGLDHLHQELAQAFPKPKCSLPTGNLRGCFTRTKRCGRQPGQRLKRPSLLHQSQDP